MAFTAAQQQEIRLVLQDMLASDTFVNSSQMSSFLRFVVEQTLDGKSDSLKGFIIGVDALGKPDSFDPTTDPSVRVMAGRLRQSIDAYNRETAKPGAPIITLPKGSYVPRFEFPVLSIAKETGPLSEPETRQANATPSPARFVTALALLAITLSCASLYLFWSTLVQPDNTLPQPRQLLVEHTNLPVIGYDIAHDTQSMPEWISPNLASQRAIVALSRFNEYRFIPQKPDNQQLQTDYQLNLFFSGSLAENRLDLFMTLSRARSNEIVWSNRYTFPPPDNGGDLESIGQVEVIVSGLLSPYGIVYGDLVGLSNPPPRLSCIQSIYRYFSTENLHDYSTAIACGREAHESNNAPSSTHALLSFLMVEAYRRNFTGISKDPLTEAREHATLAITLDEANARAYQAMFAVEKVLGNRDAAIEAAERAIVLNPFDRDIIGDFAAYLVSIGDLEGASIPLEQATRLTPSAPAWLQFYQFLHADLSGNALEADRIVMSTTRKDSPLVAIARLLAYERNGNRELLRLALETMLQRNDELLENPEQAFLRRGFSPAMANTLAGRINRARQSDAYREMAAQID